MLQRLFLLKPSKEPPDGGMWAIENRLCPPMPPFQLVVCTGEAFSGSLSHIPSFDGESRPPSPSPVSATDIGVFEVGE